MSPNANQTKPPSVRQDRVGRSGEPVFALAFRGGGFDTIMQLGVIHALMVSERRAPDAVAGVSAG
ncbi:MAG TPA: patatin-like phospholipase family protein, partial [Nitrospiraceae bacterium]|nr:patatin-like phospholipase family protein [Nitrospiraceae bacterium]